MMSKRYSKVSAPCAGPCATTYDDEECLPLPASLSSNDMAAAPSGTIRVDNVALANLKTEESEAFAATLSRSH